MAAARVRLVASWDGWCGTCRTERPLVLTRTGRRGLRSWWAGGGVEDLPLTLTCRLCGVGVHVPADEEDDPEVVLTPETADEVAAGTVDVRSLAAPLPAAVPVAPTPSPATPSSPQHQALADALAALLRARTAAAVQAAAPPSPGALPAPRPAVDDVPPPFASEALLDLLAAGLPGVEPVRR